MKEATVRVRVVDLVHNADGHPVLDGQGRPKRCGGTYLCQGKAYLPGDIIEMPASLAEAELKMHGGSEHIPPVLERAEAHEERLRKQAEVRGREDHERTAFLRKQAELEAQVAQSQRLKELVRQREAEVSSARAEVPAEVAERLRRLEDDARRRDQEAAARAAQAELEAEARAAELSAAREAAAKAAELAKAAAEERAKAEAAAAAQAAELEALRKELAAAKAGAGASTEPPSAPPTPAPAGGRRGGNGG